MLIQLKCSCENCREWAIIELQGTIEIQQSELLEKLRNLEIGTLCKRPAGKFALTVGYHELEGTQVTLKKPMLVFKSERQGLPDAERTEVGTIGTDTQGEYKVELQVIGIIRQKLLFKNRPKALISKPEVKVKGRVKS
ncbi:hypothetical protein R1flu_014143 [Riccia fluitans]|uniref:Chromosome transmission fidelity protein 8 n=1 Tax=Riccia fluitans TaxID=41844 RepID=A0ABD1YIE5_9MARC